MIRTLKNVLPILLTASIAACGLAEPTDPLVDNPDIINPEVISSLPANKGTLKVTDEKISFELNEAIDTSTLASLNNVVIITGTNELIEGVWSFNESDNNLTFTLKNRPNIPAGIKFKVAINGQITDTSNNPLTANLQLSTPGLFDINLTATGLQEGESLKIIQDNKQSVIVDANNKVFVINADLAANSTYILAIDKQTENSFCSLSNAAGTINNSDIEIEINCHNVKPIYSDATDWNQYHRISNTTTWIHGGEFRSVRFPTLSTCDDYYAEDTVKAFRWNCSLDDNNQVIFTSNGLKKGKGLADLITFGSPPNWTPLELNVLGNIDDRVVEKTNKGIWWTNPVLAVNSGTPISLPKQNAIYLIQEDSPLYIRREITQSGISLVIKPGIVFQPNSNNAALLIASSAAGIGTWIEGNIDASGSLFGIKISAPSPTTYSSYVRLNNVHVNNAKEIGIEIIGSLFTNVVNSSSKNNKGTGIYISNPLDGGGSQVQDTQSINNGGSGFSLNGPDTTLVNINADNNAKNGIDIFDYNNKINNSFISNNRGNGITLSGASNNIITSTTVSSNGESGLKFGASSGSKNSQNNIISSVTIVNNMNSGIQFDTDGFANKFINTLDAYNAALNCPSPVCNDTNITSISLSDSPVIDLFVAIDPNLASIRHFSVATTIDIFTNSFQSWGNSNPITNDSGSGSCNNLDENNDDNNFCTMFDWALNDTNTIALNKLSLANSVIEHTFLEATEATSFLANTVEIMDDNIGNDNGLCETNESCLFTPNIGSFQGLGDLQKLDNTNDLNAALFQY